MHTRKPREWSLEFARRQAADLVLSSLRVDYPVPEELVGWEEMSRKELTTALACYYRLF